MKLFSYGSPLTVRGWLLFILLLLLLKGAVFQDNDVVAAVMVCSLLCIITLLLLGTLLSSLQCQKHTHFSLFPPALPGEGKLFSHKDLPFVVRAEGPSSLPLYSLSATVLFEGDPLPVPHATLSFHGKSGHGFLPIRFPHRGYWRVHALSVQIEDLFGVTQLRWPIEGTHFPAFEVSPVDSNAEQVHWPVISSRSREGDQAIDSRHRLGEPFDLKTYHPSDGLRKVVWKIFAKSGQLYSRHPEASMTPEGEVSFFLFADYEEDFLCSDALRYITLLEGLQLKLSIGCLGMGTRPFARDRRAAERLFLEAVWDTYHSSATDDFLSFLSQNERENPLTPLERVLICLSPDRFQSAQRLQEVEAIGRMVVERNCSPIFLVSELPFEQWEHQSELSRLHGWLYGASKAQRHISPWKSEFYSLCMRYKWEMFTLGEGSHVF